MQKSLSEEEKKTLRVQHKKERDKRVCDRIKAVLLFDEGWSYSQIAHVLLLSDEAVREHVQEYFSQQKLKPENGGSTGKLDSTQTEFLLSHLQSHTYLYAKDIVAYIQTSFAIKYTVSGITFWLKEHGFSHKKPAVVPGKADAKAQQEWIWKYEELKRQLGPTETICFIDGVHPTHNTQLAYGWIRKGERKEIFSNSGRQRLNLSGAIDIFSRKVCVHEDVSLCAASTIAFLQKLESVYPKMERIHVFCDNARYYKNKEVTQYLKTSKLEMHFLPPYSPNLNPIERLWKFLKERVLYNRYYEKFSQFREAVLGFLRNLSDPPGELLEVLERRMRDRFRLMGLRQEDWPCEAPRTQ